MEYQIHLPQFEGPFDLLLFFIERDEIDIYNIPISKITDDFLQYLHSLEQMQIEVASEFIAMAARLMKIKAATLLPRPIIDEKGEIVDPRSELVSRLVEYKAIKDAQLTLEKLEEEQFARFQRGIFESQFWKNAHTTPSDELQGITLNNLMKVFTNVVQRYHYNSAKPKHVIQKYPYTVEVVKADIIHRVTDARKIHFTQLFVHNFDRYFVVFSFLCILELIAQQKIHVVIGEQYNNFWLIAVENVLQGTAPQVPVLA